MNQGAAPQASALQPPRAVTPFLLSNNLAPSTATGWRQQRSSMQLRAASDLAQVAQSHQVNNLNKDEDQEADVFSNPGASLALAAEVSYSWFFGC